MPNRPGSTAMETSAEPKPVRVWVKTPRKIINGTMRSMNTTLAIKPPGTAL
jgi:hypothetical protein